MRRRYAAISGCRRLVFNGGIPSPIRLAHLPVHAPSRAFATSAGGCPAVSVLIHEVLPAGGAPGARLRSACRPARGRRRERPRLGTEWRLRLEPVYADWPARRAASKSTRRTQSLNDAPLAFAAALRVLASPGPSGMLMFLPLSCTAVAGSPARAAAMFRLVLSSSLSVRLLQSSSIGSRTHSISLSAKLGICTYAPRGSGRTAPRQAGISGADPDGSALARRGRPTR